VAVPNQEQRVPRRLAPGAQGRDQAQPFEAEVLKLIDENVPIGGKSFVLDDHVGLTDRPLEGQEPFLLKPTVELQEDRPELPTLLPGQLWTPGPDDRKISSSASIPIASTTLVLILDEIRVEFACLRRRQQDVPNCRKERN